MRRPTRAPFGAWPLEMWPETAAAYCDEPSIDSFQPIQTQPATHDELMRFVRAADDVGEPSIGNAATIACYWLQLEINSVGRLSLVQHYGPAANPHIAQIYHHKTRGLVETEA